MGEKSKKQLLIIIVIIVAAICVFLGISGILYVNSAPYKAGQQLEIAFRYMEELDYERAVASLLDALSIDPRNEKVLRTVGEFVEQLCDVGHSYGQIPDTVAERQIASYVLQLDPSSQEGRLLQVEAEFLDGNYEAAVDLLLEALAIDSGNEAVQQAVEEYVEQLCEVGRGCGEIPDAVAEREVAGYVLGLDPDNEEAKLLLAEADYLEGNYGEALDSYEDILKTDADNEEALQKKEDIQILLLLPGYRININSTLDSATLLKELLELGEGKKWEEILSLVESEDMEQLLQTIPENDRLVCQGPFGLATPMTNLLIGWLGESLFLYFGDYTGEFMEGQGTMLLVRTDTYGLYEGTWEEDKPNGYGAYTSWAKGEQKPERADYEMNFVDGLLDGEVPYVTEDGEDVLLMVDKGSVQVDGTDERGRVRLWEEVDDNGCALVIQEVEEENGYIKDASLGLPEFGGKETALDIALVDVTPPVMSTTLVVGDGGLGGDERVNFEWIQDSIKAVDNVDGNISKRIVMDPLALPKLKSGESVEQEFTCSVSDSMGNQSLITVKVFWELSTPESGYEGYYIEILAVDRSKAKGVY